MLSVFVFNNVSPFDANIRKLVYSLWRSLSVSGNALVRSALCSDLFAVSPAVLNDGAIFFLIVYYIVCFVLLFPYCVCVCLSITVMGLEPAIEIKLKLSFCE